MTSLYIDTNIIIDAVEGRKNIFGKNIGNPAADLFLQAASCKYQLILSTWMYAELSTKKTIEETRMFFEIVKKKIITVSHTEQDIKKAKEANPDHFQDELHGILALKANTNYIVTRNTDDFKQFKERISIKKPEDLL